MTEPRSLPSVSIIIPMRNEESHIGACLESVLANDYPHELMEVLVIDGVSTDHSVDIVKRYMRCCSFMRLLYNPKKIAPSAMNMGIREAKGDVIIRMDAHSTYERDYIRQCVSLLEERGVSAVGGNQRGVGTDYVSSAIALATTNPFGAGDAYFRYANREMYVDTVYLGAWRRETLEKIGGFNEDWAVNEDYELNYRIRKSGGKILLSPRIRSKYFVRDSLTKLAKQYFRYGRWKVRTLVAYPESLRARQLVPPLFVFSLSLSLLILPYYWQLGVIVPSLYGIASLLFSLTISLRRGIKYLPLLPLIFLTMHLSWGLGFISGLKRFGIPKIRPREVIGSLRGVK